MTRYCEFLVVGAGMAGLGAMARLAANGADYLGIEDGKHAGGWAASDETGGYIFDRAGHFLHVRSAAFAEAIAASGEKLVEHRRRALVMLGDYRVPYPIQFNLSEAPEALRTAVIEELRAAPSADNTSPDLGTHLRDVWGNALMESFFEPYNRKLWGRPLSVVASDALGRFIPRPDPNLVRLGAERGVPHYGYNTTFQYPAVGGIGALAKAMARPLEPAILFGCRVRAVDLVKGLCVTDGDDIRFERLISTTAAPTILEACGVSLLASDFEATCLRIVGIGLDGAAVPPIDWIYVPEPALPFHRIVFTGRVSPAASAKGKQSILIETTVPARGSLPPSDVIADLALRYLDHTEILPRRNIAALHEAEFSPAYIVDPRRGQRQINAALAGLPANRLWLAGRFGNWDYHSMEDSYLSGVEAALSALQAAGKGERGGCQCPPQPRC